jgi:hypothetical protein
VGLEAEVVGGERAADLHVADRSDPGGDDVVGKVVAVELVEVGVEVRDRDRETMPPDLSARSTNVGPSDCDVRTSTPVSVEVVREPNVIAVAGRSIRAGAPRSASRR